MTTGVFLVSSMKARDLWMMMRMVVARGVVAASDLLILMRMVVGRGVVAVRDLLILMRMVVGWVVAVRDLSIA
jgi:hypothetical protein